MAIISANPSGERASGMYNAYGAYLIDAANLTSLASSVAQIEGFATKEAQATIFVTKLRNNIANAKSSTMWNGTTSAGARGMLDNFIEMLSLTKVTPADITLVQTAINTLKKYMDDATYPQSSLNSRKIALSIADTLAQIDSGMMYAAMSS